MGTPDTTDRNEEFLTGQSTVPVLVFEVSRKQISMAAVSTTLSCCEGAIERSHLHDLARPRISTGRRCIDATIYEASIRDSKGSRLEAADHCELNRRPLLYWTRLFKTVLLRESCFCLGFVTASYLSVRSAAVLVKYNLGYCAYLTGASLFELSRRHA